MKGAKQMLTKEQEISEVWGERYTHYVSTALFLTAILMMCASEFDLIWRLWFKAEASFDPLSAITFPFVVLIPGLGGFSLMFIIRRLGKNGQVSPATAAQLRFNLALLLMMTYLAIVMLASQCRFPLT